MRTAGEPKKTTPWALSGTCDHPHSSRRRCLLDDASPSTYIVNAGSSDRRSIDASTVDCLPEISAIRRLSKLHRHRQFGGYELYACVTFCSPFCFGIQRYEDILSVVGWYVPSIVGNLYIIIGRDLTYRLTGLT